MGFGRRSRWKSGYFRSNPVHRYKEVEVEYKQVADCIRRITFRTVHSLTDKTLEKMFTYITVQHIMCWLKTSHYKSVYRNLYTLERNGVLTVDKGSDSSKSSVKLTDSYRQSILDEYKTNKSKYEKVENQMLKQSEIKKLSNVELFLGCVKFIGKKKVQASVLATKLTKAGKSKDEAINYVAEMIAKGFFDVCLIKDGKKTVKGVVLTEKACNKARELIARFSEAKPVNVDPKKESYLKELKRLQKAIDQAEADGDVEAHESLNRELLELKMN